MNKLLTKEQQSRVDKIEEEISEKGYVGDSLSFRFLREKKIEDRRIYFLIYDDLKSVLMVSVSDKKAQQATIDKIKQFLPEFRILIEELIKST